MITDDLLTKVEALINEHKDAASIPIPPAMALILIQVYRQVVAQREYNKWFPYENQH